MAAVLVHRRVLIFAGVLSWISLDPAWGATDPLASWTNGPAKQARAKTTRANTPTAGRPRSAVGARPGTRPWKPA